MLARVTATGSAALGGGLAGGVASLSIATTHGLFPLLQDDLAGDAAGRAHDAAAGMRGGAAHIEVVDRRAVVGPAGNGAEEERAAREKARPEKYCLA